MTCGPNSNDNTIDSYEQAELDEILLKMRQRYASQREEANWDA